MTSNTITFLFNNIEIKMKSSDTFIDLCDQAKQKGQFSGKQWIINNHQIFNITAKAKLVEFIQDRDVVFCQERMSTQMNYQQSVNFNPVFPRIATEIVQKSTSNNSYQPPSYQTNFQPLNQSSQLYQQPQQNLYNNPVVSKPDDKVIDVFQTLIPDKPVPVPVPITQPQTTPECDPFVTSVSPQGPVIDVFATTFYQNDSGKEKASYYNSGFNFNIEDFGDTVTITNTDQSLSIRMKEVFNLNQKDSNKVSSLFQLAQPHQVLNLNSTSVYYLESKQLLLIKWQSGKITTLEFGISS